jgi:Flp pilus assembly protein TadD
MSHRVLIATLFALAAGSALSATASAAPPPPITPNPHAPTVAQTPAPPPKPEKATPEQRAEADRLSPLGRAAFWAREVDIDPTDYDARLKLAKALRALGKYEEAAAAADQLLVVQPNNLEALMESARARLGANEGFYAIDDAQRAAQLAPRDWRPVSILAIAYEQSDRDSDALAAHQKALALAPDNPATLTNLGLYYATHGDAASAEPLLRRAAAAPGAGAPERQNLALVLGLEGKIDEAQQLERLDLPPEVVRGNLAYLQAEEAPPRTADSRTWDSLRAQP